MSYILKERFEPHRLDDQSESEEYSLQRELQSFDLSDKQLVLDAGCGSGVLCRYLESYHPGLVVHGCDISDHSLAHGRQRALARSTKLYRHDLLEGPTTEKYDAIINRLVFHHLSVEQQRKMLRNFRLSLKPNGRLCVIDLDGLFLNLATTSPVLRKQMEFLSSKFNGDLSSARFLPTLLGEEGFGDVSWEMITLDFQGIAREKEVHQWAQRFESSLSFYVDALGSEFEARTFFRRYLEEARRTDVALFYNKFIVKGVKA